MFKKRKIRIAEMVAMTKGAGTSDANNKVPTDVLFRVMGQKVRKIQLKGDRPHAN